MPRKKGTRKSRRPKLIDDPADYGLYVKKSKIHGHGLFTDHNIKKGERIAPYNYSKSNIMTWKNFKRKHGKDFRFTYSLQRQGKIINIKKARNLITMINDARPKENTFLKKKALWAKKNIRKGQELTLSYPHYNPAAKKTRKKR